MTLFWDKKIIIKTNESAIFPTLQGSAKQMSTLPYPGKEREVSLANEM